MSSKSQTISKSIQGVPISGRIWKQPKIKGKNSVGKTKSSQKYIKEMKRNKSDTQNLKLLEKQLKEDAEAKREALKQRRRDNALNRQENLKKSEVTQNITNPKTIKKIRKGQLHKSVKIRPNS